MTCTNLIADTATPALAGPLIDDARWLADRVVEATTTAQGQPRYRIAGVAMAWCNSLAEAVKIASILTRMSGAYATAYAGATVPSR